MILAATITAGLTLSGETTDAFELPGTESQVAIDALAKEMPGAGGASARLVFEADEGSALTDPATAAIIGEAVAAAADAPQVLDVSNPVESGTMSEDQRIGLSNVTFAEPVEELSDESKAVVNAAVDDARAAGLTVEVGGDALAEEHGQSAAELIGLAVAIVVLLFTFGSVVAAGLPILTALIGVAIGLMGITAATGFIDMSSTAPTLAIMLGLAVGIDYALFIATRHRQLMASGVSPEEAAAQATGTAGSAVVFAGATVVIALIGLVVVGIPFLSVMGVAAAATVAVAVLISLTLLPALLGFAGYTIDRFRVPGTRVHSGLGTGRDALGLRWGKFVVRHARPVLGVSLVAVAVISIPAFSIEMGLPDDGTKSTDTTERRAFDLQAEAFGPGFNSPLILAVDVTDADNPEAAASQMSERVAELDNVVRVSDTAFSESGNFAVLSVIPGTGPSDRGTATLVDEIRVATDSIEDDTGAVASVTGAAAMNIDITNQLAKALPVYALLVVGLALVLLTMVFRSVLVPVKAAIGFLLSVGVSFGATVALFQWGWLSDLFGVDQTGPIISMLPILLLGILFGLAMDYEVFLVSRIREDYIHNGDARDGIVQGLRHSSRVIVAAGLIMVSVFAAFILAPGVSTKMIGFALAVGVLADAFLVRMTIVPAVLALLGDRAWWLPRWLDRIIPNVDIEGESLAAHLNDQDPPAPAPELAASGATGDPS
jgi:RND superfamily putative drug exporter